MIIFSSCSRENKKEDEMYRSMEMGFENASDALKYSVAFSLESIDSKLKKPFASEWPKINPPVQIITTSSDRAVRYIDSIKREIDYAKRMKGIDIDFKKTDYDRIYEEKEKILTVDSFLSKFLKDRIGLVDKSDSNKQNEKEVFFSFFKDKKGASVLALLSRLKNNIIATENEALDYYNSAMNTEGGMMEKFGFLVGQSTQIIEGGKELTITTGIGSYDMSAKPEILINNKRIVIEDGQGTLKIKAPDKPGNYTVPVVVKFIDREGISQTEKLSVKYKVSDLH